MARRRQADHSLPVEVVAALLDERFPLEEFNPATDDWNQYVRRCRAVRAQRHALTAEYGFTPLDLLRAKFGDRRS